MCGFVCWQSKENIMNFEQVKEGRSCDGAGVFDFHDDDDLL